jgi:hypothetical protein
MTNLLVAVTASRVAYAVTARSQSGDGRRDVVSQH